MSAIVNLENASWHGAPVFRNARITGELESSSEG
jgi:hypothetical protein